MGQSLIMTILPSFSSMVALISPTFSLRSVSSGRVPSRMAWRASRTQVGHSESVCRGQPRGGLVFSCDFNIGLSDQFGVIDGLGLILLSCENTAQSPLAAMDRPFSAYLIGACMCTTPRLSAVTN